MELHSVVRWHMRESVQQPRSHAHPNGPEGLTLWPFVRLTWLLIAYSLTT